MCQCGSTVGCAAAACGQTACCSLVARQWTPLGWLSQCRLHSQQLSALALVSSIQQCTVSRLRLRLYQLLTDVRSDRCDNKYGVVPQVLGQLPPLSLVCSPRQYTVSSCHHCQVSIACRSAEWAIVSTGSTGQECALSFC